MQPTATLSDPATTLARYFTAVQEGDRATLLEVLTPDAVTRWPQSGETITGAMSCVLVYENYPGGCPQVQLQRVVGSGDVWVAELVVDYGTERWFVISISELEDGRIARITDYFGPKLPAPEWRSALVDPVAQAS